LYIFLNALAASNFYNTALQLLKQHAEKSLSCLLRPSTTFKWSRTKIKFGNPCSIKYNLGQALYHLIPAFNIMTFT